jgi:orotate phosphoribosyltransferase
MVVNAMTKRQELIELLAKESIKRGQFTLASGKLSTLYIDARLSTMSPQGFALIGPVALEAIKAAGWEIDSVGGLTLGADPVAYSISNASNLQPPLLRAFTVRKEAKIHGTGNIIEGPFQHQDRVAIVEDVITTGASALRAINAITNAGGQIKGVLALIDREEGGREAIEKHGYSVISLIRLDEILASST